MIIKSFCLLEKKFTSFSKDKRSPWIEDHSPGHFDNKICKKIRSLHASTNWSWLKNWGDFCVNRKTVLWRHVYLYDVKSLKPTFIRVRMTDFFVEKKENFCNNTLSDTFSFLFLVDTSINWKNIRFISYIITSDNYLQKLKRCIVTSDPTRRFSQYLTRI